MDFKVYLSEEALSDLEQIVAYLAPQDAAAAERMGVRLLDAAVCAWLVSGTRTYCP